MRGAAGRVSSSEAETSSSEPERSRPGSQHSGSVERERDTALHVGDPGSVHATTVVAERALGGRSEREDGVVVAQERDASRPAPLERRVQIEALSAHRYELGVQAVRLGGVGHDRGERVQLRDGTARRVDVDPRLEVAPAEAARSCATPPATRRASSTETADQPGRFRQGASFLNAREGPPRASTRFERNAENRAAARGWRTKRGRIRAVWQRACRGGCCHAHQREASSAT